MNTKQCEKCCGCGFTVGYAGVGIPGGLKITCKKCNGFGFYDDEMKINNVPIQFIKEEYWDEYENSENDNVHIGVGRWQQTSGGWVKVYE